MGFYSMLDRKVSRDIERMKRLIKKEGGEKGEVHKRAVETKVDGRCLSHCQVLA